LLRVRKSREESEAKFMLKKHHTPRYLLDRIMWGRWQKANPDKPWLVPASVDFLDGYLRDEDVMVEFGSGRSTRWFAGKVGTLVSIEDSAEWYEIVKQQLVGAGLGERVHYRVCERAPGAAVRVADQTLASSCSGAAPTVVLNDAMTARDEAAIWAAERLVPGGLLVIDNVNRYLPCGTRSPESIGPDAAPPSELWEQFAELSRNWRRAWWTQGVTDTAVFFKPHG